MASHSSRLRMRIPARLVALFLFTLAFLMTAALSAGSAPRADGWPRWQKHDPFSGQSFDHSDWTEFLSKYVRTDANGVNLVAYGKVSAADRKVLSDYIARLELAPVSAYARPEQLAFWINLYNAVTVQTVLSHYPVASIRDIRISPGWFTVGPWGKKLVAVEDVPLSLDDMEHRILRPIWKDARVHYALNCAAVGCPNLAGQAYIRDSADTMLTAAAIAYVNDPRGVLFDGDAVYVSSIYRWFAEDFGGSARGVLDHLRKYASPPLRERLGRVAAIGGYRYDWSLNDLETGEAAETEDGSGRLPRDCHPVRGSDVGAVASPGNGRPSAVHRAPMVCISGELRAPSAFEIATATRISSSLASPSPAIRRTESRALLRPSSGDVRISSA
ncbi:MAG: DUF547 domain-containing protein [Rhodospirillaceae bacterium]